MENDKDTVCPVLFILSDVNAMEILSCPSKVHRVQTIVLSALSNKLPEERMFLYH